MVVDNQHRPFGGNLGYEHLYSNAPHFTDPWASQSSAPASNQVYSTSMNTSTMPVHKQEPSSRPTGISMPYSSIPVSAPSMVSAATSYPTSAYGSSDLMGYSSEMPKTTYATQPSYATSSPATSNYSQNSYPSSTYGQSLLAQQHQQQRKMSDQ